MALQTDSFAHLHQASRRRWAAGGVPGVGSATWVPDVPRPWAFLAQLGSYKRDLSQSRREGAQPTTVSPL